MNRQILYLIVTITLFASTLFSNSTELKNQESSTSLTREVGELLWSFEGNDEEITSPVIDNDGNLYFAASDISGIPSGTIYCTSSSGELIWSISRQMKILDHLTLDLTRERVYVPNFCGSILCLDFDGNELWEFQVGDDGVQPVSIDAEGKIFYGNGSRVGCLNPDGESIWTYNLDSQIMDNIVLSADGTVYFGTAFSKLIALDTLGNEKFIINLPGYNVSSASIDNDGNIYIGSTMGKLSSFTPSGTLRWQRDIPFPELSTPILCDDFIYLLGINSWDGGYGKLYKLDRETREEIWNYPFNGFEGFTGSPVLANDGSLYFNTSNMTDSYLAKLHGVSPDGQPLWDFNPYLPEYSCGPNNSPVIAPNGTLYMPTISEDPMGNGFLFAFDAGDILMADTEWPICGHDLARTGLAHNTIISGANILVSTGEIDLGIVALGQTEEEIIQISNLGNEDLHLTISTSHPDFDYAIDNNTIPPETVENLTISFTPVTNQLYRETLHINSNDIDQPVVSIELIAQCDNTGQLKWQCTSPIFTHSSPAIDDFGNLYFCGQGIVSYDPDGNLLWTYNESEYSVMTHVMISNDNSIIYYLSDSKLLAVSNEGEYLWEWNSGNSEEFNTLAETSDGNVVVCTGLGLGSTYLVNPQGEQLWRYQNSDYFELYPVISNNDDILVVSYGNNLPNTLNCLDQFGNLNWSTQFGEGHYRNVNPVMDANGYYYVSSSRTGFDDVLVLNDDEETIADFSFPDDNLNSSFSIDSEGNIYFFTINGYLVSMDSNLTIRWTRPIGTTPSYPPVIAQNGHLYYMDGSSDIFYGINSDGETLWEYPIQVSWNVTPVIGNDSTVYYATGNNLYAFYGNNQGLANSPWPMDHNNPKHNCRQEDTFTSLEENELPIQPAFSLTNYPNPFNPSTIISYSLAESQKVKLEIYNIKGQLIKTLINSDQPAGKNSVAWNGRNNNNQPVASGIYFSKLKTDESTQSKKLILLK